MADTPAPSLADLARNLVFPPEPPGGWTEATIAKLSTAQRFALAVNSFQVLKISVGAYRALGPQLLVINRECEQARPVFTARGMGAAYDEATALQLASHQQHQAWRANIAKLDWVQDELRKRTLVSLANSLGSPGHLMIGASVLVVLATVGFGMKIALEHGANARRRHENVKAALAEARRTGATPAETVALVEAAGGDPAVTGGGDPRERPGLVDQLVDKVAWPLGLALATAVVLPPLMEAFTGRGRND